MKLHVDQSRGIVTLTLTRENVTALGLMADRADTMPAAAIAIDGDWALHVIPVADHEPHEQPLTLPATWEQRR